MEEDPILDLDRCQFTGADADQGEFRDRTGGLFKFDAVFGPFGPPEEEPGREQERFPRVCGDRKPEEGVSILFLEPVLARPLDVGPPDGKVLDALDFRIPEDIVSNCGADEGIATGL